VSRDLGRLSGSYDLKAQYSTAIKYAVRALMIDRVVFGREHDSLIRHLNAIGSSYEKMGEKQKVRCALYVGEGGATMSVLWVGCRD